MEYHCTKCSYVVNKDKVPNTCPYCSSEGTIAKKQSAQELIDSVMFEMKETDMSRKERGY